MFLQICVSDLAQILQYTGLGIALFAVDTQCLRHFVCSLYSSSLSFLVSRMLSRVQESKIRAQLLQCLPPLPVSAISSIITVLHRTRKSQYHDLFLFQGRFSRLESQYMKCYVIRKENPCSTEHHNCFTFLSLFSYGDFRVTGTFLTLFMIFHCEDHVPIISWCCHLIFSIFCHWNRNCYSLTVFHIL